MRRVAWRDVTSALTDDETRSLALRPYRDACFTADSFGHKTEARRTCLEGLIRAEDWLEVSHPARRTERSAIRELRRRLETELYR